MQSVAGLMALLKNKDCLRALIGDKRALSALLQIKQDGPAENPDIRLYLNRLLDDTDEREHHLLEKAL